MQHKFIVFKQRVIFASAGQHLENFIDQSIFNANATLLGRCNNAGYNRARCHCASRLKKVMHRGSRHTPDVCNAQQSRIVPNQYRPSPGSLGVFAIGL